MPDAPAVLTAEGTLSYAELDRAVSWTAGSFRKAGLGPGDMAGIYLSGQVQHLVTSLALARLGAGQVAFDGSDPPRLRQELARRLKIAATVAEKSAAVETGNPRVDPPAGSLRELKRLKPDAVETADDGALPCLTMRSSGTTGVPKAGLLTHEIVQARLGTFGYEMPDGPGCRYMPLINISFDSAKQRVFHCLTSGGCLAFHEGRGVHASIDFVAEHRITYIDCVPRHAAELLKAAKENEILFPGIAAFRVGSTMVPEALRTDIQRRLTPNLYVAYGSNEVGVISMAPPALVQSVPGVVGKLVPGMEAEITGDDGNPLPSGAVGKVRLKSAGMIGSYVEEPAETALVFRDGWFYPGDLAEFTPDGALIHHGRADEMMILDGINIYPAEIENALLRHPAVAEAAVFPIRSVARGDVPVAAVVTKSQVPVDALRSHCRSWLGAHTPPGLMIVSKLPRNAVGKVLKNELARLFHRQIDNRQSEHSPDRGGGTRDPD